MEWTPEERLRLIGKISRRLIETARIGIDMAETIGLAVKINYLVCGSPAFLNQNIDNFKEFL